MPDFPTGTGIGFLQVVSREEMRLRSWGDEGDPCACASAALVAAVVNGFTDREVFVRMSGGDVFLQWEELDNHIWLTGPAAYVFTGDVRSPGGSGGAGMKGFTDRLADFLRSILGSDGDEAADRAGSRAGARFVDPDLQDAWKELDDYMNTGREAPRESARERARSSSGARQQPDESLRQDYVNLEVPFGASLEDVKSSYKRLMMRYHPDKFAGESGETARRAGNHQEDQPVVREDPQQPRGTNPGIAGGRRWRPRPAGAARRRVDIDHHPPYPSRGYGKRYCAGRGGGARPPAECRYNPRGALRRASTGMV